MGSRRQVEGLAEDNKVATSIRGTAEGRREGGEGGSKERGGGRAAVSSEKVVSPL